MSRKQLFYRVVNDQKASKYQIFVVLGILFRMSSDSKSYALGLDELAAQEF